MLRTPARYTFSNPNTGFPFLLVLEGKSPGVRLAPSKLAIERLRDREDAACLSGRVGQCETINEAAALLASLGCTDLEAEYDPATPEEQAEIDARSQLGAAIDHLVEAYHLSNDFAFMSKVRTAIRELRKIEGD